MSFHCTPQTREINKINDNIKLRCRVFQVLLELQCIHLFDRTATILTEILLKVALKTITLTLFERYSQTYLM